MYNFRLEMSICAVYEYCQHAAGNVKTQEQRGDYLGMRYSLFYEIYTFLRHATDVFPEWWRGIKLFLMFLFLVRPHYAVTDFVTINSTGTEAA